MIWNWLYRLADKVWMMDKENGVTIGTPEDLSLNGTLSNFFSRKGIMFDQNTGLFKTNNEYSVKMHLEGWVKNMRWSGKLFCEMEFWQGVRLNLMFT